MVWIQKYLICMCMTFYNCHQLMQKTRLGAANAVNIWKETVEYEELTINERQKGDGTFFKMLDYVRHGCLTDETIDMLKSLVFKVSITEKYKQCEREKQIFQFTYFLR
uniref:Uncharacterized protein n=1 Tax=Amphimedon queenslandica TaxID=400682 RepID=A0A1X7V176_AMPQE